MKELFWPVPLRKWHSLVWLRNARLDHKHSSGGKRQKPGVAQNVYGSRLEPLNSGPSHSREIQYKLLREDFEKGVFWRENSEADVNSWPTLASGI